MRPASAATELVASFLAWGLSGTVQLHLQRWVSRPPAPQRRLTISLLWTIWMRRGALSAPRAGDSSCPPPSGRAKLLSAPPRAPPPQFSPPFLRWPTMRHLQTACSQLQLLHSCSQRVAWGHAAFYRHGPGCSNCRLRLRLCHNPPSFSTPCSSCSLEHARVWFVAGGHATHFRCLHWRSVASHFHPEPLPRLTPGGRRCLALWSALAADPALAFSSRLLPRQSRFSRCDALPVVSIPRAATFPATLAACTSSLLVPLLFLFSGPACPRGNWHLERRLPALFVQFAGFVSAPMRHLVDGLFPLPPALCFLSPPASPLRVFWLVPAGSQSSLFGRSRLLDHNTLPAASHAARS